MPKPGFKKPKPKPVPCVACGGTGRSSTNKDCIPCAGTGEQGKGKYK